MISSDTRTNVSPSIRRTMIDSQLRPSGVNDMSILSAMVKLPREEFVPAAQHDAAYSDRAVPLGNGYFLAPPLVHGRMLTAAAPTKADRSLLVTGSGNYLAELLAPMVGSLQVIEPSEAHEPMIGGPFSLVIIDGAVEIVPTAIIDAMSEGARMVTGIVERGISRLALGSKTGGEFSLHALADIAIPSLTEMARPQHWSF